MPYDLALSLTQYIENEEESLPWEALLDSLSYLRLMTRTSTINGAFKSYMRSLLKRQVEKVGFMERHNDNLPDIKHRINILRYACSMDTKDCVEHSRNLFSKWMNTVDPDIENPIPKNLRGLIYCSAISNGGEEEWDFAWTRYLNSNIATEKTQILSSLTCTKEPWLINRYLIWAISPNSGIRKQDTIRVYRGVAKNQIGAGLTLDFLANNWIEITDYMGYASSLRRFGSVISSISEQMNSQFDLVKLRKVIELLQKYQGESASESLTLKQAVERVEANILWTKNNYANISTWFINKRKRTTA